jgi:hypothetical protein
MSKVVLGAADRRRVSLDVDVVLKTRLLIQGGSGSGKSWLLRRLAEQLFGKLPVIIIDPEGEFATLRKSYGYVLVGQGGETPADPRSAALVAHKLLELHASAVCDIFELKPADRHLWVQRFLDAMIDAPKTLWQPVCVIVDEAHLFCPEKGAGESVASDAMIALTTRGRKRGYVAVFATQRLSKLRKDAAAELQNVLIGRTFIENDRKRAVETLGIAGDVAAFSHELKTLPEGHFWAFGPAITLERTLVHVGGVETPHPKLGASYKGAPPPAPETIRALLPKLADLPHEAEKQARTEGELRAEIAALKREKAAALTLVAPPVVIERPMLTPAESALLIELGGKIDVLAERLRRPLPISQVRTVLETVLAEATTNHTQVAAEAARLVEALTGIHAKVTAFQPTRKQTALVDDQRARVLSGHRAVPATGPVPKGERAILTAAAMYPEGVTRDEMTLLAGYKRSTRDEYINRLAGRGLVEVSGNGHVRATPEGIAELGAAFERLPTGAALLAWWRGRLPDGECKILDAVVAHYPQGVRRERLDEATGFRRSTRDEYVLRLMRRRLVTTGRNVGDVIAAVELFD